MRVANSTVARNYTTNLNKNLASLVGANYKVASGRKFNSMAEDTATGVRALGVRRNLAQLSSYLDNAKNSQAKFDSAEKAIGQISELAQDVYARFNYALNGTNGKDERDIIANEFERLQEEILTSSNGQYADRYMFGGTNTQSRPFSVNADGELMYNGERVKDIDRSDPNGKYAEILNDAGYVDIGLGLTMQGNSNNVVTNSAFKHTINGLDFMGTGDNNIYDTITEIVTALRDPNFDPGSQKNGDLLDKIKNLSNEATLVRTKMGADAQYLEFTVTRLDTEQDNLITRQDDLEFADPSEAIMDFNMQQYVYNAALQMGSKLLQPTIFNFIS